MPGRRPVVWFALAALLAVGAMVLMSRTGSASGGAAQVVVAPCDAKSARWAVSRRAAHAPTTQGT